MAGVSDTTISAVERGHWRSLSIATIERIAAALEIRFDISASWRGGDGDRLLNRSHSAVAESFAAWLGAQPGWVVEPEVSFSVYGERGVIDLLGWHADTRHLVVVEVKTELVDVNELLGTFDRKLRLARSIARERDMAAARISGWLIVLDTRTNRRHAAMHTSLLSARFQADIRALRRLAADPARPAAFGLAFWTDSRGRALSRVPAISRSRIRVSAADLNATFRTRATRPAPDLPVSSSGGPLVLSKRTGTGI